MLVPSRHENVKIRVARKGSWKAPAAFPIAVADVLLPDNPQKQEDLIKHRGREPPLQESEVKALVAYVRTLKK